jgi:serine protease Do
MKDIRGAKVEGFGSGTTSAAERAGMQAGDIIITADGQPVDRVSTLQRIVRNHAPGESVDVEVMRYGQKKTFRVRLTELEEATRTASTAPVDSDLQSRPSARRTRRSASQSSRCRQRLHRRRRIRCESARVFS